MFLWGRVLVAGIFLGLAAACRGEDRPEWKQEPVEKYWGDVSFGVPSYRDCPFEGVASPDSRPLLVTGRGPGGTKAEFFCAFAVPDGQMPAGGWPGVLLVHGGGGTAYPFWVEHWRQKGFAVLAPDWYNQYPVPALSPRDDSWDHAVERRELPGGKRNDIVANVANFVAAHSLLRSMPEVNPEQTVYVGLSWGSWYGAAVAAVDGRFKGVCEIYCGDVNRGRPDFLLNGRFLWQAKVPMWWIVGVNDTNVTPETSQAGFDACARHYGHTVVPRLLHGHIGYEFEAVLRMARHFACGEPSLPILGRATVKDGKVSAPIVRRGLTTGGATLAYTCDRDQQTFSNREWLTVPAAIIGDRVEAALPDDACQCYLSLHEEKSDRFATLRGSSSILTFATKAAK